MEVPIVGSTADAVASCVIVLEKQVGTEVEPAWQELAKLETSHLLAPQKSAGVEC